MDYNVTVAYFNCSYFIITDLLALLLRRFRTAPLLCNNNHEPQSYNRTYFRSCKEKNK